MGPPGRDPHQALPLSWRVAANDAAKGKRSGLMERHPSGPCRVRRGPVRPPSCWPLGDDAPSVARLLEISPKRLILVAPARSFPVQNRAPGRGPGGDRRGSLLPIHLHAGAFSLRIRPGRLRAPGPEHHGRVRQAGLCGPGDAAATIGAINKPRAMSTVPGRSRPPGLLRRAGCHVLERTEGALSGPYGQPR